MTTNDATHVLEVGLGARSYPIRIGAGVLATAGDTVAALGARRAIVVTNPVVGAHWRAPLEQSLVARGLAVDTIEVPDGEAHKTLASLERVLTRLLELKAERSTMLVALGGGVVGDLAGFAAAVYQRGMPFVQVPTTLLSQVDSSVGGKTGVNHPLGKNMIGAFYQPRAVLIDTRCLATLPPRELSAGLAEVIKYGVLGDAAFFSWLEANMDALVAGDAAALAEAVAASCRMKAAIVARDEREEGERMLLNLGHTFGHAIESGMGYGAWLHGEAVGTGTAIAARVSQVQGRIGAGDVARIVALLERAKLPTQAPALGFARWKSLMARDKKVAGGSIRYILLDAIGQAVLTSDVSDDDLRAVLS